VDSALGDYNAARTNYEKALETQRHVYGENAKSTDLASTLSNLGLVDSALGDYNAARMNYEKALEMKRHYGENAKNTNLAGTHGGCISIAFVFFPQWSNHLLMNK
jgi:tetratricopeptide (TPR) repeat protein